jgi:hypothetical protein
MSNALDKVRAAALELPETSEKVSHGQPTFFVAGKQFAQFRDNHHGDGKTVVCVRVSSLDEQAMLLEADPETYFVSAEAHERWRGDLPYDRYPMRRIASINVLTAELEAR